MFGTLFTNLQTIFLIQTFIRFNASRFIDTDMTIIATNIETLISVLLPGANWGSCHQFQSTWYRSDMSGIKAGARMPATRLKRQNALLALKKKNLSEMIIRNFT